MGAIKDVARRRLKRAWASTFVALQRAKLDALPQHFYSPIPNIARLRATSRWRPARSMVGVEGVDIAEQLAFVREVVTPELRDSLPGLEVHARACAENGAAGYGPIEADFLYCFVHTQRPARIVQVGAGVTTSIALRAGRDAGYAPQITAIDPYPTEFLRAAPVTTLAEEAQDVPLESFTGLESGDLLLIDSTHTVKADSEVNLLIHEVLPRLKPGVRVHFHDIYFPYDYQRDILDPPLYFWSESSLLHAFLIGNRDWRIEASMSMLHYAALDEMRSILKNYRPGPELEGTARGEGHFPAALYLRRG